VPRACPDGNLCAIVLTANGISATFYDLDARTLCVARPVRNSPCCYSGPMSPALELPEDADVDADTILLVSELLLAELDRSPMHRRKISRSKCELRRTTCVPQAGIVSACRDRCWHLSDAVISGTTAFPPVSARPLADLLARLQTLNIPRELRRHCR
jgi:hypothetical protein